MLKDYIKKQPVVKNLYSRFFKNGERIFSREMLFTTNHNSTINRNNNEFKVAGKDIKEIKKNIDKSVNSVLGWFPYLKDKTSVFIYHFFSTNYAIRKQAIIRLTIVSKLKIMSQKIFLFPAFSVHDFKLDKHFSGIEGDTIFVEMFHPGIKKNHGDIDGHLRVWVKYYEDNVCTSTVHSSRLPMKKKYSHKFMVTRNYNPSIEKTKCYNYSISNINHEYDFNKPIHEGYNILFDEHFVPRAVWHHGHTKNAKIKLKENYNKSVQSFWCPKLKGIDPNIFIDSKETGVLGENESEILIIKENKLICNKKIFFKDSFNSAISQIFGRTIEGPYICHIVLKHNYTDKYVHINYNSVSENFKLIGDSVHSLDSHLKINEKSEIISIDINKPTNTRKFMHFSKFEEQVIYYLIIHVPKLMNLENQKIKVRFYTDTKNEYVLDVPLDYNDQLNVFDLKKLLEDNNTNINLVESAIVQIESIDYNYPGYLMRVNSKNKSVGIDHLSGG